MADKSEERKLERIMLERREFIRIPGSFVVSYQDISTAEARSNITQTKNISAGGLLFTTDEKFRPGTVLRLKLRLPDSPDYIHVKVQVVGSKSTPRGMLTETRVKFIGIKDEDKAAITRLVNYSLQKRDEEGKK